MGKKGKSTSLKHIYNTTQELSLPTQHFKFEMKETSIACGLCATRCSSCMHFGRVAAVTDVGTGDFTDKTSTDKRAIQCSSNDGILFSPSLSSECNCRHHTSSEASSIFSFSSSQDSFSENAESKATFRDSDNCKDIELLLNIRKAQPARESGDTPKGLSNFDAQKFSNLLKKHKELEILSDNISCIGRSVRTNLAISNHNNDPGRKKVSCSSASDDNSPVEEKVVNERLGYLSVAATHFDKANGNHSRGQNFSEEPSPAEVENFECSSQNVESSLAKAAISGLGSQIDGICSYATFGGSEARLNCFETETHSCRKDHLQEFVAMIEKPSMQESRQSQPGDPGDVSDLMEDEIRICDTCGDEGFEELLAVCNKCNDGAEHIYCMRVVLDKVPKGDWTCEECMLRAGTEKLVQDKVEEAPRRSKGCPSENSINPKSSKSSKLKFRSSCAGKSWTNDVSSASHLSAKRHGVPLEAQSVKKARAIGTSAVPSRSSKPYNNSLMCKDLLCKKIKKVKMRSVNEIVYSGLQSSCNSQGKAKVPRACGDKRHVGTLEAELDKKGRALQARVISPKTSKPSKQSLLSREPPFKKLVKVKLEAGGGVTSLKQSSHGTKEKTKLPSHSDDESPKLGSQAEIASDKCSLLKSRSSKSNGQLAKGGCLQKQKAERNSAFHDHRKGKDPRMVSKSVSFDSVISEKSNATCSEVIRANAYGLHDPAMCLLASDSGVAAEKSEKESFSSSETLISGSSCCNLNAIQNSGQLDHRLQPSNRKTHKDANCPNEKKKKSRQAEHPTKDATAMSMYKSCTGLASDERLHLGDLVQVEAEILYLDSIIPMPDYAWLGKFQIHSTEGIASACDGIQAHLSTCASPKVLEVVDRLPETIILEELPRMRIWPSQFMGSQATEENIGLYFFAKDLDSYRTYYRRLMDSMINNDLALKGNLDGVELLIFPSKVLPEKSQRWNQMFFFWGVFRGRKVNNSANTSVSNSQRLKNIDTVKSWAIDLNAYPQDEDDTSRVDEIPQFDSIDTRPVERILLVGESSNSGSCSRQPLDKGCADVDLNLSLWPKSATPEDGPKMSLGIADNQTNEEVHGEIELLMDENNNADNGEKPSTSPSLERPSTVDPLHLEISDVLILLAKGPVLNGAM